MTSSQPRQPQPRSLVAGTVLCLVLAAPITALAYSALLGLGLHRHAPPTALSLAATTLVFVPAVLASVGATRNRLFTLAAVQLTWSAVLFATLPVYFPGERADAITTGLTLLGLGDNDMARTVAEALPEEPDLALPEVPLAAAVVEPEPLAAVPLDDDQIALPYEGEGRRLSVPVAFAHGDNEAEISMMLDTGATYTTLPAKLLKELGVPFRDGDPVVTLHTANGERRARILLIDRVWLGDMALENVAIAVCEECESSDNKGLLGLNVSGNFNLFIDADRQEVVFTKRPTSDRHIDVSPFLDTKASFSRFPGGRIEVTLMMDNRSDHPVSRALAEVSCGKQAWTVELLDIPARTEAEERTRLPEHEPCDAYRIRLERAWW